MEANEITNDDTQPQADIPEFERAMQTPEASDGSFEEALGLPYQPEVAVPHSATTQQMEQQAQQVQQQPSNGVPEIDNTANRPPNDEVRYEYWQSEATKLQNQLKEVEEYKPMVDYLRNNPEAAQSLQAKPEPEPAQETFPDPPARPQQPHGFSRDEAMADGNSDSAKYLHEVDEWRDTMTQYNQLSSQYQVAQMQEVYDQKISDLEKINLQRSDAAREQQTLNNARDYVTQNYDLGDKVEDFISEMGNDSSINMDDLVGYYKYKHGMAATQVPNQQAPNQAQPPAPSRAFNQVKRAQSVPSPMNVISGQTEGAPQPGDIGRGLMESLINDDKSTNIL
jgi:hypothetical protein